jgi:hypothetical protein
LDTGLPEGPEHCSIIPGGLSEYPVKDFKSSGFKFTKAFLNEDRVIYEREQRGMHSRKSRGGKLVSLEKYWWIFISILPIDCSRALLMSL